MDDEGNELNITDDMLFCLTPKGFLMERFKEFGASEDEAEEQWHKLEAFCVKQLNDEDGTYAALVFDGCGGQVAGLEKTDEA
jgi:hypothetical protein